MTVDDPGKQGNGRDNGVTIITVTFRAQVYEGIVCLQILADFVCEVSISYNHHKSSRQRAHPVKWKD